MFLRNDLRRGRADYFANREVIVQFNHLRPRFDPVALVHTLEQAGQVASVLLDASGGRGIESTGWPEPLGIRKMGYAGGIKPENIQQQLQMIQTAASGSSTELWVDMESGVRTACGLHLDLERVRRCLSSASPFVR